MRKKRGSFLVFLVVVLLALVGGSLESGAQINLLDKKYDRSWGDYTWGAYGGNREASRLGREELVARENYCPSSGCVLRLDKVQVLPLQCRRGECITMVATYSILTPEQIAIPVSIVREVLFRGKSLGRTKTIETRQLNGTWSQEVDFTLPPNALPGTYTVNTRVSTGYAMEQKSAEFQVY
jgi:hypothetical protein